MCAETPPNAKKPVAPASREASRPAITGPSVWSDRSASGAAGGRPALRAAAWDAEPWTGVRPGASADPSRPRMVARHRVGSSERRRLRHTRGPASASPAGGHRPGCTGASPPRRPTASWSRRSRPDRPGSPPIGAPPPSAPASLCGGLSVRRAWTAKPGRNRTDRMLRRLIPTKGTSCSPRPPPVRGSATA